MNMIAQTAAAPPRATVNHGVGRFVRLMAAGTDKSGDRLRLLLMVDPSGAGPLNLTDWPRTAHGFAPAELMFHAAPQFPGGPPVGSVPPVKGAPIKARRLGDASQAQEGIMALWTQAMTGDGKLPAWSALSELLRQETATPPTARFGLLRDAAGDAWREARIDHVRRVLAGVDEPSGPTLPEAIERRASRGGWEGLSRAEAIRETLRLAHAVGEAELDARQRWEVARLSDPERAFARLAEPSGPMLASIDPRAFIPGPAVRARGIDPAHLHAAAGEAPTPGRDERLTPHQEAARLRWGQLLSNPTLMRLFGLVFDYEVEARLVPEGFWLLQPQLEGHRDVWTLARRGAGPHRFWPCQREECDSPRAAQYLTQRDGFANLRQQVIGSGAPRYQLNAVDGIVKSEVDLSHRGLNPASTTRSHGLALLDAAPSLDAVAEDAAERRPSPTLVHDGTRLRTGWQMDVRIGGDAAGWRSQMLRHVRYRSSPPGTDAPPTSLSPLLDPAVERLVGVVYGNDDFAGRRAVAEAAVIAPAQTEPEYDTGFDLILHESIVAHWTGRSHGIARQERRHDAPHAVGDDPRKDAVRPVLDCELGLTTIYALDAEEQALEIGVPTDVRLRAVYRGGVAPPPEAAEPPDLLLPAHVFRREEPLGSPEILLLEIDVLRGAQTRAPLQTNSPEDSYVVPRERPTQRCRDVVLRRLPNDQTTLRERRVILPPTAPLELLERLLAPRDSAGRLRRGLRTTDVGRLTRGWPGVRAAGDTTMAILRRKPTAPYAEMPRDAVFRALPRNAQQDWPYQPDPHAAICIIEARWPGERERFCRVEVPVYEDRRWPDPRPIILETVGEARPTAGPPTLSRVAGGAQLPFAPSGGEDRGAHLVRLHLSPGEMVQLRIWFVPSPRQLREDFGIYEDLARADRPNLDRLMRHEQPYPPLSNAETVDATHAIAAFSAFQMPPALSGQVGASWESGGTKKPAFTGQVTAEKHRIATVELLASGAALVSGRFDDPEGRSRGRDRRARGEWPTDPAGRPVPPRAVFGFDMSSAGVVSLVPEASVILTWDTNGPSLQQPGSQAATLALAHFADALPGALYDGKARHVTLTPLATPRGAALLRDADGAPVPPTSLAGTPWSFWLPARDRPSPPISPEIMPVFRWRQGALTEADSVPWQFVRRSTILRIRVARPWLSSGEGERLGVLLWPPNIFRLDSAQVERDIVRRPQPDAPSMDLSELSELDIGRGGSFITRWGDDPTREGSTALGLLLHAAHLAEARSWTREENVRVPLPRADDDDEGAQASLLASLLTAAPRFDPDSEEWYADLPIDLPRTIEPFLRLGLVRWQPHAPDSLRCSTPVVAWGQVQPARELCWRIVPGPRRGRILQARVQGAASRLGRSPADGSELNAPDLRPSMEFILTCREPLPDGGHSEAQIAGIRLPSAARPDGETRGEVQTIAGGLRWSAQFELPALPEGAMLHLTVRETEEHLAATPLVGDLSAHIVKGGARFAAQVRVDGST